MFVQINRKIAKVLPEGYDINMLNDGFRELIHKLGLNYLFTDTPPGPNVQGLLSIILLPSSS